MRAGAYTGEVLPDKTRIAFQVSDVVAQLAGWVREAGAVGEQRHVEWPAPPGRRRGS